MKYDEIHPQGYETVSAARQSLVQYFDFYNRCRLHSLLEGKTPKAAYFNPPRLAAAA